MTAKKPEILRPNFGQHTPAIDELLKRLSETIRYRDAAQKSVDQERDRLHQGEQRLVEYNRAIESYRGERGMMNRHDETTRKTPCTACTKGSASH
jgi:hypothetical protein